MSPMLDVLATAGGSIVLAAFFVWLLVTAVRQEGEPASDRSRPAATRWGPAARP